MSLLNDPDRFRRTIAGLALIGAPAAGFVSCFTDSNEGTGDNGAALYATVSAHSAGIAVTGVIFMLSGLLTAPAAFGLAHLLRRRGVVLGHLSATCLLVGAFGHFGYGLWQWLVSRAVVPGEPADATVLLGRISAASSILVPLMILIDVGVVLLSAGLLRSRAVPAWAPWTTIAAIAADLVIQFAGITATWPATALWGVLVLTLGSYGIRVLRMPASQWASLAHAVQQRRDTLGVPIESDGGELTVAG